MGSSNWSVILHINTAHVVVHVLAFIVCVTEQSDGDEEVDEDLIWAQLLSFKQSGWVDKTVVC